MIRGWLSRRQWLVVGILATIVVAGVAAAITFDTTVTSNGRFAATPEGPRIFFNEERNVSGGARTFPADNTIHIETAEGSAFYNGSVNTTARVDTINRSGWSNVSQLDVSAGNLSINPNGIGTANVSGGATELQYLEGGVNNSVRNFHYESSGAASVTIPTTNATDGVQYGMVDVDSNEGLAVGVADATGDIHFADADGGDHTVKLVPLGTLTIREEREPHSKISGSNVEVRFFEDSADDPAIFTRTDDDNDGQVDLTGLPTDNEFVAQISAPGYHNRTVLIDDLAQQQSAFLLAKTGDELETAFTLTDQSGSFPPSTSELIIEHAINVSAYDSSEGVQFLAVAGDDLGADAVYTTDLEDEDRYRIRVRNEVTGETRLLGAYTAEVDGTVSLEIDDVTAEQNATEGVNYGINTTTSSGDRYANVEYNDTQNKTDTLYIEIFERGNRSNKLLTNQTFTDQQRVSVSEKYDAGENDTEWTVRIVARRGSGAEDVIVEEPLSPRRDVLPSLPTWLTAILSLGMIWVVGGLFSQVNADIGAVTVAGLGAMLWFVGFVDGTLGAGVVVLALVTSGLLFINERRDGGL